MPAPKKTPRPKANPKMDPMEADRSRGVTNRELLNYNRAMSRMGKKGTTMKDGGKVEKMKGGGLAMLSPAYALAKSLESGKAEGLMKLSPAALAMSGKRKSKDKATDVGSVTGMKAGGKCRGMGAATKGGNYSRG